MIVHLGLSEGKVYFLHEIMENPPRGLVCLEAYRTPQWCRFEKIITFESSKFRIEKDGHQWVVCDWCNTPNGLLYAGVEWFDSFIEAYDYEKLDLFGIRK